MSLKCARHFIIGDPQSHLLQDVKIAQIFFEIINKEFFFKIDKLKINQEENIKIYDKCPETIDVFLKNLIINFILLWNDQKIFISGELTIILLEKKSILF